MRLYILLIMLMFFLPAIDQADAQNLIPNPGFEEFEACPEGLNPFPLKNWNSPTRGNPDYFNACALEGDSGFAIPSNNYGTELPFKGSGYAGITVHSDFPAILEYIQVELKEKLQADEVYHFSVQLSLAEFSEQAIANFSLSFLNEAYSSDQWERLNAGSNTVNLGTRMIKKSVGWQELQGFYQAKGGESHLIFGNFSPYHSVNKRATGYKGKGDDLSYYYVDEISLSKVFPSQCKISVASNDSVRTARKQFSRFLHRESLGAMDIAHVYFDEGSDEFFPACEEDLQAVLELLNEYPAMAVSISGHCDRFSEADNYELSERRAEKIAAFFLKNKVAPERIDMRGYGSNHPAVEGDNKKAAQENRRVEMQIKKLKVN